MKRFPLHVSLSLLLLGPACVIDTVPMPENNESGDPDGDRTGHLMPPGGLESDGLYFSAGPVVLVGEPNAVEPDALVLAENKSRSGYMSQAPSASDGSFAMWLNAEVGDIIGVSVAKDGVRVAYSELTVAPGSVAAFGASEDLAPEADDGGQLEVSFVVSPPNPEGDVTITGGSGAVSPGIMVVVANLTRSGGASALASLDGSFSTRLHAKTGDVLVVFAVEPASSNGGGIPINVVVP